MGTPVTFDGCRVTPGAEVEPIECEAPGYGIFSVSTPIPITDPHLESGTEWMPWDCSMADAYCNSCTIPGDEKEANRTPDLKVGTPFAVVGSFSCSTVGFSLEEARTRARKHLELGEQRRVEREFIHTLQGVGTTDLTPVSGAVGIVAGIAALEDYAGTNMACLPTIHVPRGVVTTMAAAHLLPTTLADRRMRTYTGSLVSAGGGYDNQDPSGDPAADGEAWIYLTGQVHIWQGDVFYPDGDQPASRVNRANNDLTAFAERVYVTGYECDAVAIRVNLNYGC